MSKKFISFLGTNDYSMVNYVHNTESLGGYSSKYIQEALVRTVCKEWDNSDKAIIFVTAQSEKANWYNATDGSRRLKTILEDTQLNTEGVLIPAGQNEEEIWEIFHIVMNHIEKDDQIVLDITHAFRYIPMLATIILDYGKVVKDIEVLGIYYGAWDMRDQSTTPNRAPIFNLTSLVEIQEWSQAVNTFIKYGNSGHLEEIARTNLRPRLAKETWARETNKFINKINDFTMNINTGRGKMIEGGRASQRSIQFSTKEVKDSLVNVEKLDIQYQLKPLIPLMSRIRAALAPFDENSTLNTGLDNIEWCINNHLIQQAYTALEETLKTYICHLNNLDVNKYENREEIVNTAINKAIRKSRGIVDKPNIIPEHKKLVHETMEKISNSLEKEFIELAGKVKMKRNDINHFGFNNNPATYKALEEDIKDYYREFLEIIDKNPAGRLKSVQTNAKRMLLVFSHKLTEIQEEDARSSLGVDKFIYLPEELQKNWSGVDPYVKDIDDELQEIFQWIAENSNAGDYVLIQGDYGATYKLVKYCKSRQLRPVYSTTKREAMETKKDNNTIILSHKVSHIRYREY